jgi:hypothetical protein
MVETLHATSLLFYAPNPPEGGLKNGISNPLKGAGGKKPMICCWSGLFQKPLHLSMFFTKI